MELNSAIVPICCLPRSSTSQSAFRTLRRRRIVLKHATTKLSISTLDCRPQHPRPFYHYKIALQKNMCILRLPKKSTNSKHTPFAVLEKGECPDVSHIIASLSPTTQSPPTPAHAPLEHTHACGLKSLARVCPTCSEENIRKLSSVTHSRRC